MSQKNLNEDQRRQLKEFNSKIDSLREQLEKVELEKSKLMEKIYNSEHEVIDAMPGYLKNDLRRLKITTDSEFNRYLDGEFKEEDFKVAREMLLEYRYFMTKTRKERLMLFRCVGEKTADKALKIIEQKGL